MPEETDHPQWYLDNYSYLGKFLELSDAERGALVSHASAIFGTLLASMTEQGKEVLTHSGLAFAHASVDDDERFKSLSIEQQLCILLGVAAETMGILQMRIEEQNGSTVNEF